MNVVPRAISRSILGARTPSRPPIAQSFRSSTAMNKIFGRALAGAACNAMPRGSQSAVTMRRQYNTLEYGRACRSTASRRSGFTLPEGDGHARAFASSRRPHLRARSCTKKLICPAPCALLRWRQAPPARCAQPPERRHADPSADLDDRRGREARHGRAAALRFHVCR